MVMDRAKNTQQGRLYEDFMSCDGYIKDVDSAVAFLSSIFVVCVIAIVVVEKLTLLYFQWPEQKYRHSDSISLTDKSKYLQTRNLTKTYPGNVQAVKSISFDLHSDHEILGLLGANGAGKTSTFNMVTMQAQRTSGDVFIFNKDISSINSLREVNITSQDDILWPYLSIEEHFKIISMVQGKPFFGSRLAHLTRQLELDKHHKMASILSGGNKRKLCTALTLLTAPKLAYFDEPTVGLDPVSRRSVLRIIKQSNSSVLFTTHRLDEAEYLCTRVQIMAHGKFLYDGGIDEIKKSYSSGETGSGSLKKQQGLILVQGCKIELHNKLVYLEVEESASSETLFKIVYQAD